MSTSFQVSQPTEVTIRLTIQNNRVRVGNLTVEQQQPQQVLLQAPQQLPQPCAKSNIDDLLRGFHSLSMNNDPVEQAATLTPLTDSLNTLEPPVQLNHTKRRERASQRARPCPIPIVSDADTCGRQQRRAARLGACPNPQAVLYKSPVGGLPLVPGSGTSKLMRAPDEQIPQCKIETEEEIARETDSRDGLKHKSHHSSLSMDSPYPSSSSYHESSSPRSSGGSVAGGPPSVSESVPPVSSPPVQPVKRGRGRPRKVRPEGAPDARPPATGPRQVSGAPRGPAHLLQPRPVSAAFAGAPRSVGGSTDFVPAAELAEATKVISRYTHTELITVNDRGELLCHTLAREGNWAKLIALNLRLLSNASLGDLFTGINTANDKGQTALIHAVVQQNVKAVEYCCLFTCSTDKHLFRALVESALLPSQAIFITILQKMCTEMDENGNPTQRRNRHVDHPISDWSFMNPELNQFAGLTLAQVLILNSPEFYPRLSMLIACGADPRHQIEAQASEKYRLYIDSVYLAAAFSKAPFECLQELGLKPEAGCPFSWDTTGKTLNYCVDAICRRADLDMKYRQEACTRLHRMFILDDDILSVLEC